MEDDRSVRDSLQIKGSGGGAPSALTRLAHKYQIDTVRRYAPELLRDEFTTNFGKQ